MKRFISLFLVTGALSIASALATVPSLINYQGRLTDSNGDPVVGSKNFTIAIYDASTAGNVLYTEDVGSVTLDAKGIYSFQFGVAGASNVQVDELIATTNGSATTYQNTLSKTVTLGSLSVTDGTYNWNEVDGNLGSIATANASVAGGFVYGVTVTDGGSEYTSAPIVTITGNGSGATATATVSGGVVTEITVTDAGSGYTTGVTVLIAPPSTPFRVDYSGNIVIATYEATPPEGRSITASYSSTVNGMSDALAKDGEHWMEISIDGEAQTSRQRVLVVPFAMVADHSNTSTVADSVKFIDESQLDVSTATLSNALDEVAMASGAHGGSFLYEEFPSQDGKNKLVDLSQIEMTWDSSVESMTTRAIRRQASFPYSASNSYKDLNFLVNRKVSHVNMISIDNGSDGGSLTKNMRFNYRDGSNSGVIPLTSTSDNEIKTNPHSDKVVTSIRVWGNWRSGSIDFVPVFTDTYSHIDLNLTAVSSSVHSLRILAEGLVTDGGVFQDCIEWLIKYSDGSLSQPSALGKSIAIDTNKTVLSVRLAVVTATLGDKDLDISKVLIRKVSK